MRDLGADLQRDGFEPASMISATSEIWAPVRILCARVHLAKYSNRPSHQSGRSFFYEGECIAGRDGAVAGTADVRRLELEPTRPSLLLFGSPTSGRILDARWCTYLCGRSPLIVSCGDELDGGGARARSRAMTCACTRTYLGPRSGYLAHFLKYRARADVRRFPMQDDL
jgi:hypothetical protein